MIFMFTGSPGIGKTALALHVCAVMESVTRVVLHTTRPPRKGEMNGVHYHFVDDDRFSVIAADNFIEWTEPCDYRYGTAKHNLTRNDVLLNVDVQTARIIKNMFGNQAVYITIQLPSCEVVTDKLVDEVVVVNNLAQAKQDVTHIVLLHYVASLVKRKMVEFSYGKWFTNDSLTVPPDVKLFELADRVIRQPDVRIKGVRRIGTTHNLVVELYGNAASSYVDALVDNEVNKR